MKYISEGFKVTFFLPFSLMKQLHEIQFQFIEVSNQYLWLGCLKLEASCMGWLLALANCVMLCTAHIN